MRLPNILFIATLLIFSLLACKNNTPDDTQDTPMVFQERTAKWASKLCDTDENRCATIEITYPVAIQGNAAAVQAINDSIVYYVKQSIGIFASSPEELPASMDSIAVSFIREYELFIAEQSDYEIGWEIETNGQVLYQSAQYVAIELSNYSYAGGAHPNGNVTLLNFDARSGKKLEISDLVTDSKQLAKIAELEFRKARELTPDADFAAEGFFWGEGFKLPTNIAITEQGLYFYYNPYEVAAYAAGPTDFVITYEALKPIWK